MKIDRLIGIIMILLQQDKITAPELAKKFEVSRRTINRDIENLCKAGIPLVTAQGYDGGISIADNYKVNKTFLTQEELQSIVAGLQGIDSISKTSQFSKLKSLLFSNENSIVADDVIIIDLASHYQKPLTQKIEEIKKALFTQHLISFSYYCEKGESHRSIEPYKLIFKWSSWYVFGYCLDKNDYRLFKLNRLWNLSTLKTTFAPRSIPDEKLAFEDYFNTVAFALKAIFAKGAKHRLIEEYGVNCYTEQEDGSLLLERDFANYENMREWIFSFGDTVEILAPKKLKEDRIRQAQNILINSKST